MTDDLSGEVSFTLDLVFATTREFFGTAVAAARDLIGRGSAYLLTLDTPTRNTLAAAMATVFLFLFVRLLRTRSPGFAVVKRDLKSRTRAPRMLGYLSTALFVGCFGVWSSVALLASAVVAQGVISPEGYRKTVQHLEGGIIRTIHVREGDTVVAGQSLVTLEAIDARARYDELHKRYLRLLATEARLVTELAGKDRIVFPLEVTSAESESVGDVVAAEQDVLSSRIATRAGRERILDQRKRQIEEQISGLEQVMAAQDEQLALIDREIQAAQELYNKGLDRLPHLLDLQRAEADIRGNQASNRAQAARGQQEIGETEMQLLTSREQDRQTANEDLAKVRGDLAEVGSQLPARRDALARTVVTAPISGTVMNVRVTTESGVIAAGHPILDIVPNEANLVVDSRIKPTDIDMVHPDMQAQVVLTAYPARHLPHVHGLLISVSADRLIDERTGEPYFLAKIRVDQAELQKLKQVRVTPGMPAEVMLMTGEHTLLDYVLAPMRDSFNRGLREN
jgi:HlyD family type I secretion membrane fusion protein